MDSKTNQYIDIFYCEEPYVETFRAEELKEIPEEADGYRVYYMDGVVEKKAGQSRMVYFGESFTLEEAKKRYPNSTLVIMCAKAHNVDHLVRTKSGRWEFFKKGDVVISPMAEQKCLL